MQNLKHAIETRLRKLLAQNPLRTDFQLHYEQIVAEYNREKDRVTIEKTFEALLRFYNDLTEEESRAVREGLSEETLAVYDLLKKPDLSAAEIQQIKKIAVELLALLKADKLRIERWLEKENTRDDVFGTIRDYLWSDRTGLPLKAYTPDEVLGRTEAVFYHIQQAYPVLPSLVYGVDGRV